MNSKYSAVPEAGERIVYVRSVAVRDLPDDVKAAAEGAEQIYSVHDADGERIALVKDRKLAFILARQNDMAPVSVH